MPKTIERVLVTGGFGYVGSRLVHLLLTKGYKVSVIDLCLYGEDGYIALKDHFDAVTLQENLRFIEGDIRSPKIVEEALQDVDAVIHLAAISNDPTGEVDEVLTRQVNYDAVGLLVAMARQMGVKRFINASSSSVFGIKDDADVTEFLEPEPLTYYSRYKQLSEWILLAADSPDFCTVNIRPATICGVSPRQRFDLTVNILTAHAIQKGLITVHGGEQRRPNVGMTDICNLYLHLLEIDESLIHGRTFNFGFENHKIIDIAKIIRDELDAEGLEINITDTHDKRDYHISSKKILNELSYQPVSSIREEVRQLKEAFANGQFDAVDDPKYSNMKSMQLKRNAAAYEWLSR